VSNRDVPCLHKIIQEIDHGELWCVCGMFAVCLWCVCGVFVVWFLCVLCVFVACLQFVCGVLSLLLLYHE
jgi:hypothetical protein